MPSGNYANKNYTNNRSEGSTLWQKCQQKLSLKGQATTLKWWESNSKCKNNGQQMCITLYKQTQSP